MDAYTRWFSTYLLPFYETRLRRRNTFRHLERLERNQWMNFEKLQDIQWKKLKRLLRHACRNVPYYRKMLNRIGLTPSGIQGPEDFSRIPVLRRKDIGENQVSLLADNAGHCLFEKTTSGTTGEPIRIVQDRNCYEWHIAGAARSDRWAGWDFGKKELYIWGTNPYRKPATKRLKEKLHHLLLRRTMVNAFDLGEEKIQACIHRINTLKPSVIIAYANAALLVARYAIESKSLLHRPLGIIISGERIYPSQKNIIRSAFQTDVFERYGCQEVMLIACECDRHEGLHMNMDNLYIEIIRDGRNAIDGELGEVVITDLNNYAMPLIRYANGDLAIRRSRACSCGRQMPLLEKVEGRSVDTIVCPSGRHISGELFLYIIDRFAWVKQFSVTQEAIDLVTIQLVAESPECRADLANITCKVQKSLGDDVKIECKLVSNIPPDRSGKRRFITSRVDCGFEVSA